ncbi:Hypp2634 [Branchiostoma lanceolatum]|uniref:Hypp2634 protein n=1 Tax=Branchiostoma lanceolatum TaxID=7740 RepID=A0A8J9ZXV8_BRALA|nr:Hypp2634 [Branchiostoma lanceolatum]
MDVTVHMLFSRDTRQRRVWFVSVQNKGGLDTVDVVGGDELVFSLPRPAATQESSSCSPADLLVNRRDYHPHVRNSAVPPPASDSHNICWDPARWRK